MKLQMFHPPPPVDINVIWHLRRFKLNKITKISLFKNDTIGGGDKIEDEIGTLPTLKLLPGFLSGNLALSLDDFLCLSEKLEIESCCESSVPQDLGAQTILFWHDEASCILMIIEEKDHKDHDVLDRLLKTDFKNLNIQLKQLKQ